ncbi:hypothetical protein AVEN_212632-1 [Araneus ventricosus]|uniref:Uncharacterized protein n=1 Tax=Araneus ventricosus TaxID=182803 RepID=A0A4Y2LI84_ARAVE|nr:hypothetical protein AVEN_212632-1 [Araneus ventricosus]
MLALCFIDPHKPSITGWQVTLSAFLLLVPELFEKKKFVLLSRFNQDALENYFSQVRRMTILLQWTSCTRTRLLLAELMFAMCGNANYEPDDNIILESTHIIPQTDEDCLDLVIDEPSWICPEAQENWDDLELNSATYVAGYISKKLFRKSTVNSANQIYASNAATATIIFLSFKEFANSKTGLQYPSQLFVRDRVQIKNLSVHTIHSTSFSLDRWQSSLQLMKFGSIYPLMLNLKFNILANDHNRRDLTPSTCASSQRRNGLDRHSKSVRYLPNCSLQPGAKINSRVLHAEILKHFLKDDYHELYPGDAVLHQVLPIAYLRSLENSSWISKLQFLRPQQWMKPDTV